MKNMSVAAFIVSIVVGTQSLADSCSPEKAQKKAGLAAVLIDQVSFDRKGVSVVASVQIMIQDSQATYSVQTRGSEIGGNVWQVTLNMNNCQIQQVKSDESGLE